MRISDWSSDVCSSDLPPLHAEQVGGARHVDVEKGAAHQEIARLRRDILGQLGETLGCDRAGEAALAAAAHQVRHRGQAGAAHRVGHLARGAWREHLRLVDDDQRQKPMLARRVERSEEHTSELQSLMRISYAGFCMKKKKITTKN